MLVYAAAARRPLLLRCRRCHAASLRRRFRSPDAQPICHVLLVCCYAFSMPLTFFDIAIDKDFDEDARRYAMFACALLLLMMRHALR